MLKLNTEYSLNNFQVKKWPKNFFRTLIALFTHLFGVEIYAFKLHFKLSFFRKIFQICIVLSSGFLHILAGNYVYI